MFEKLFQWTCRNGARILFLLAVVVFVLQVTSVFMTYGGHHFGDSTDDEPIAVRYWRVAAQALAMGIGSIVWPLTAAIVIERIKPRA